MLILYQRMFTVNFDKILKPMLADIRFFFCHHHHHHHHQSYKYTLLFSLTFDFFKRIIEHFLIHFKRIVVTCITLCII